MSRAPDRAPADPSPPLRAGLGFWDGLRYPFRGMRFVYVEHRGLARFWVVPILLTGAALVGVLYGALELHGPLADRVFTAPGGEGLWAVAGRVAHALLSFGVGLLLAVGGLVAVLALTTVVAAPFNDALSEEVERLQTGRSGPPLSLASLSRDVARTVALELLKLALYVSVMVPLFVLSLLVPVVGPLLQSAVGFTLTAFYFALDYVDWPVARRGLGLRYRRELLLHARSALFGFGAGVWLFLLVPLVNLFFMPAAVAGGTLLYLELAGPHETGAGPEHPEGVR